MIKKISIISNNRMFFLFLLLNETPIENIIFILDSDIKVSPKIVNFMKVEKSAGLLDLAWKNILYFIKFKIFFRKFRINDDITVYGADHISGAKYFLKRYNFVLLEDGTINYNQKAYTRSWKNKLFSIPVYGMHKTVSKIILTKKNNIPDCILKKVDVVDINKKWKEKNEDEKCFILSLLNVNIENIEKIRNKDYILYTQPLSEDGIISEDEKIFLYKKALENLDISRLVIKPHPREKTNYGKYFPTAHIFCDNVPAEILSILNVSFQKAITLFSTAVLQHNKENIIFLGTKIHPKIYEHFGDVKL